jgi:hypothetical protein
LIVTEVVAVRLEVAPVAVTDLEPPMVSAYATAVGAQFAVPALVPMMSPDAAVPPVMVEPVVHAKEVVVKAVVATLTDSAEPNPVTEMTADIVCSG